jgi:protein disulfide-isomerase A6
LEGILLKRNLAPSKLDELKIKVNILRAFVAEDQDEETPKGTISREEAEL